MLDFLTNWIFARGIELAQADILARVIIFVAILILTTALFLITKHYILNTIAKIVHRSATNWDDMILKKRVFNRLAHLAPAMLFYILIPIPLEDYDSLLNSINSIVMIFMIAIAILTIDGFLNASLAIYRTYEISKRIPIKGFIQVLKIIIYFTCGVFIISILMNKTPLYLFSSLGALTAVLMFIFKDSILGFVAGIQLSANKMVSKGDWIEMPKYGANGEITEIALTTVKVQNWDKTITTVPTYALISESFRNWRGMTESGGRRIKRSINLDMNTIKFCDAEMLSRFHKIQYIKDYIEQHHKTLEEENKRNGVDDSSLVNGRRMTNVGTFRAYVKTYLENHPKIRKDMTFIVRQLAPTEHGLPIEIYVFSKDQEWSKYENIQSDIFDHILAILPEFDLRVFQEPSGRDFSKLA